MKKLKWKTLVLALGLAALGTVSAGTLAYFNAEEITHNVITSGGVDIALIEKTLDENGKEIDWEDLNKDPDGEDVVPGVMPGEDVMKKVWVENTGASKAWIRVKLTKTVTPAEGVALPDGGAMISYTIASQKWQEKDGWYYYADPVNPGSGTELLIESVHFDKAMGNEYQSCTASLDVSAQAVQVANNGASAMEAAGWPEE